MEINKTYSGIFSIIINRIISFLGFELTILSYSTMSYLLVSLKLNPSTTLKIINQIVSPALIPAHHVILKLNIDTISLISKYTL